MLSGYQSADINVQGVSRWQVFEIGQCTGRDLHCQNKMIQTGTTAQKQIKQFIFDIQLFVSTGIMYYVSGQQCCLLAVTEI